jgi:predicted nucleic acid-binding protein
MSVAEVFVAPARLGRMAAAERALRRLALVSMALPAESATELAALRAATGLRLPDCCVLLAAETADGSMATFDERLAAVAMERGLIVHR